VRLYAHRQPVKTWFLKPITGVTRHSNQTAGKKLTSEARSMLVEIPNGCQMGFWTSMGFFGHHKLHFLQFDWLKCSVTLLMGIRKGVFKGIQEVVKYIICQTDSSRIENETAFCLLYSRDHIFIPSQKLRLYFHR